MPHRFGSDPEQVIEEAARIICDDGVADYRLALRLAAQEFKMPRLAHSIDKRKIEARVIERQQLFGGDTYRKHLADMRKLGRRLMTFLSDCSPCLAGSTVSGAIGLDHRVQVHVICEPAEAVELRLINANLSFEQGERRYRFAGGLEEVVPLLHVEVDGIGADIAVFDEHSRRSPPLSQVDGKPAKRLRLPELEAVLKQADSPY